MGDDSHLERDHPPLPASGPSEGVKLEPWNSACFWQDLPSHPSFLSTHFSSCHCCLSEGPSSTILVYPFNEPPQKALASLTLSSSPDSSLYKALYIIFSHPQHPQLLSSWNISTLSCGVAEHSSHFNACDVVNSELVI